MACAPSLPNGMDAQVRTRSPSVCHQEVRLPGTRGVLNKGEKSHHHHKTPWVDPMGLAIYTPTATAERTALPTGRRAARGPALTP